jgi:hypothetical protein
MGGDYKKVGEVGRLQHLALKVSPVANADSQMLQNEPYRQSNLLGSENEANISQSVL